MAVTIQGVAGVFDPVVRDQLSNAQILNIAVNGAGKKNRELSANARKRIVTAQNQIARAPDFTVYARTSTNDAATQVLDLTAKGVTFPANVGAVGQIVQFMRIITWEVWFAGDASDETGYVSRIAAVAGGTPPIIRAIQNGATAAVAGTVFNATAAAGFTGAQTSDIALNGNNVILRITSAETAEVLNWVLKVYVGKLQPVLAGI